MMLEIPWVRYGAEKHGHWAARARWPRRKVAGLLRARRVCRNWVQYAAFRGHLRRSVDIELKSGAILSVARPFQLSVILNSEAWNLSLLAAYCGPLEVHGDWLSFRYRGRRVAIWHGDVREYHSVLREQFVDEQYRWLDVNNREVLDVGGSIGDSAIYFALNGARRVLALEPYPASFRVLQENARANHLEQVITPLCAGVGRDGEILVSESIASGSTALRPCADGVSVPTYSLASLLARDEWSDPAAKIDCEGAEYHLIMDASDRDLRRFRHYFIEFHHGLRDLGCRLSAAGFDVWYTVPEPDADALSGDPCEVGLIRAIRSD